jgi:hypothetical protein
MAREIRTVKDLNKSKPPAAAAPAAPPGAGDLKKDDYLAKLLKYIPAETIAVYTFIDGVIKSLSQAIPAWILWVVFGVILVLTPVYLYRNQGVRKRTQLGLSALAFAVWVFSLGGPFVTISGYKGYYGAIFMPLFTFAIALINPEA